ncbi:MAG TPA: OmpA family protein [Saprospiraceae bacterium]|nr:OmpA family protein [Saprospiraceae bacterium]
MSINILELVKDQVSGQLASQASSFLGESESGVAKALGGIMPALMGGMINKASTDSGSQGLMDLIGKVDLNSLGNIAGLFGGGSSSVNTVLNSGGGIVETLLGSKAGGVIDFIANMAGLKSSSSSSLLKMAAPFLMSVVGKQITGKGVGFLKDLIMGQKSYVSAAMPAGLSNMLGFSDMLEKIPETIKTPIQTSIPTPPPAPTASMSTPTTSGSGGGSLLKWLLPLLLAGAALWYFTKDGCNKKVEETGMTEAVSEVVDSAAIKAKNAMEATKALFSNVNAEAKAMFDSLKLETGSAPEQIKNYIDAGFNGDPMFLIKNVNFASGSALLSKEAQKEVDHLASLLKAYPGVKIEINGHTDNTGDPAKNQTLSEARSASIMGRLIAQGVEATRLKAQGFGQTQPIADNTTPEGMAKNRRIELKVVQ